MHVKSIIKLQGCDKIWVRHPNDQILNDHIGDCGPL